VIDNATNNDYKRRGIISKGAILQIQEGKCKVVSKPGQLGIVNAVLLKE
jgi:small subunit ribosomal protein S8e